MKRFVSSRMFRGGTAALIALASFATAAYAQTITTFDPPSSTYTVPQAINISGQIAGYYTGGLSSYGFLRQPDGTFISFADPLGGGTLVTDINSGGQIIGFFVRNGATGILRQADGTIVTFSGSATSMASAAMETEPSPPPCCSDGTSPMAINAKGQITGSFGQGPMLGFLREPDGATVQFSVIEGFRPIVPHDINFFGQITGYYETAYGIDHGFLREPNGRIITFDPTGSTSTHAIAINFKGQITGYFQDTNNVGHAFLRQRNGRIITFDPPGSTSTQATAINRKGQITGFYATADGKYHGFSRKENGKIETFDVPGAGNGGTFPQDINNLGQIVGYYQDANFVLHGFIRSAR
jgi:probable HAF family extracellular repeat protein